MITLYGIKNCDTMKKTLKWFDAQQIDYTFIDYKKVPPDESLAKRFIEQKGWQTIINKRGTTWRKLSEDVKASMDDRAAIELIQQQPSIIKRPIVETDSTLIVGYDEAHFEQLK